MRKTDLIKTRVVVKHRIGDPVRLPTDTYFKGATAVVVSTLAGNHVVVRWPDLTYTKHHAKELRRVA